MPTLGRLSDRIYAIPFGRFTQASDVAPPANEILVGREGQRAYLIELLLSTGRLGSFLVTGRRGTGKSSFVRHCIEEYEGAVLTRFLRGNSGRGFLDRLLVLLFWAAVLFGALLLSESLELLAPLAATGTSQLNKEHRLLFWFLLAPLAILLLYPCVYAKHLLETIFRDTRRPDDGHSEGSAVQIDANESPRRPLPATLMVLALIVGVWLLPPFGAPSVSAAFLLSSTSLLYLFPQALSYKTSAPLRWYVFHSPWLLAILFSLAVPFTLLPAQVDRYKGWSSYVLLAAWFFGLGLLLRATYLFLIERRYPATAPVRSAIRSGLLWYLLPGLLLMTATLILSHHITRFPYALSLGAFATLIALVSAIFNLRKVAISPPSAPVRFLPRPRTLLIAKALLSIVLALQLAHPVIIKLQATLMPRASCPQLLSRISPPPNTRQASIEGLRPPTQLCRVPGRSSTSNQTNRMAYAPLFSRRTEEVHWLLATLSLLVVFYFLEYEWILRPNVRLRELASLGPAIGSSCDDECDYATASAEQVNLHRELASLTLPWLIYQAWLPVLTVSVNLGFERLGHAQIIQAMLVGLRDRYYRAFLAWSSGFANLGRFIGAILLLVVITLVGKTWFELPPAKELAATYKEDEDRLADAKAVLERATTALKNSKEDQLRARIAGSNEEILRANHQVDTAAAAVALATTDHERLDRLVKSTLCNYLEHYPNLRPAPAPGVICGLGEIWFNLLYFNLAPTSIAKLAEDDASGSYSRILIFDILPFSIGSHADRQAIRLRNASSVVPAGVYFCVYHLLFAILLFVLGRWLFRRIPVFPYHQNLQRIDDLLDGLSSRQKTTSSPDLWGPARWIYSLFADERVRELEREPTDPRTVELAFLQILHDIQKGGVRLPGAVRKHLSLPAPEITFVFDELDKLGTRIDPNQVPDSPAAHTPEIEALHNERQRSLRLRALLSDLKNILSSAPARFIFVGGRNLYDEWLADQTSRQPLLTSIFHSQVYLPSFLTDHSRSGLSSVPRQLDTRIWEFLFYQRRRAQILYRRWCQKRWRPHFGLSVDSLARERFVLLPSSGGRPSSRQKCLNGLQVVICGDAEAVKDAPDKLRRALLLDFVRFLTYRSRGNPKKLRDLLAAFVRQVDREIRGAALPCRSVLRFDDVTVFRLQLIADVFRHLAALCEDRMVARDDKYAISVLFLTDFIFKFHRRAFSWTNLERVDDLVHIHRLPDLRDIQEELVGHFSERFLHRVLNGMYSFRFRSDLATEVEYLSRISSAEMAALNFTLDESQSLKAAYHEALGAQGGENNPDLLAALGELYDFDQDFENSRRYYQRAIKVLDRELTVTMQAEIGIGDGEEATKNLVPLVLRGQNPADARIFVSWGVARLRLMLQVGMTYEQERNLERAATDYRSARTLARVLIRAYLDAEARGDKESSETTSGGRGYQQRLHTLKHLHILFQATFAEAWLSEKIVGAVDTSASLLERALTELRHYLPYVRESESHFAVDSARPMHGNFLLTLSQLHNRAGDLYFFKGRQPVSPVTVAAALEECKQLDKYPARDRATDGYLVRAHYHYAVAMHEIRRYVWYRVTSSGYRLRISKLPGPTLLAEALPDFLCRAAASSLNDMAEATLARISLLRFSLHLNLASRQSRKELVQLIRLPLETVYAKWLSSSDETEVPELDNWFGRWQGLPPGSPDDNQRHYRTSPTRPTTPLLRFIGPNPDEERLFKSLKLCLVGASYFELGGYFEDAGRELLQVCETVTRYLWWRRILGVFAGDSCESRLERQWPGLAAALSQDAAEKALVRYFWSQLIDVGVLALERAEACFVQSRRRPVAQPADGPDSEGYLLGECLPAYALTLLCSLSLGAKEFLSRKQEIRLRALTDKWTGGESEDETGYEEVLIESLERHRYPMINRLNAMKTLIDHWAIARDVEKAVEWTEELLDLNSQFDAPLHFTPLHSGLTCALVWITCKEKEGALGRITQPTLERLRRAAQHDLRTSVEMYTLRRAYYTNISTLYYLYDDFNDRQIHFNHAIQMAGADIAAIALTMVGGGEGEA